MIGRFDYKAFIQAKTGINIKEAAKGVLKSGASGLTTKASQYVVESKTIQAQAGKAMEQQAMANIAEKIAAFYQKNKALSIGLAVGTPIVLFALVFMVIGKRNS